MAGDVGSVLGKTVEYKFLYDPEVLAREPRVKNRQLYGFDNEHLPFAVGYDSWHAYECSFMLNNGLPVNGVLKIVVPMTTEFIVESKSLKLYLFSFNMQRLGATKEEAISRFRTVVENDLSKLLGREIHTAFYGAEDAKSAIQDRMLYHATDLAQFSLKLEDLVFDRFQEDPTLLKEGSFTEGFISSDLLRSNCKITHQPDWGTVYIYVNSPAGIDLASLAQYIVSFRGENHFHEEIVECIYSRLWARYKPNKLMVTALYTRRGGIDICPCRASSIDVLPADLITAGILTQKDYRQ